MYNKNRKQMEWSEENMNTNNKHSALVEQIESLLREREYMEERLLTAENTVRYINTYYAVFAAAAAVLSLVYPTEGWQALTVMLTVMLSMMVFFLCAQSGKERTRQQRSERAELSKLMYEAERADMEEKPEDIQHRLAELTAAGANVCGHERRAILRMHDRHEKWQALQEGRSAAVPKLRGYEKFLYWFAEIGWIVLKTVIVLLPIAGMALAACGLI